MLAKKMKSECGSVTIEATISLSAFMFAMVTLLTIVNVCIVQARVSYAINTTAKEISQYSYLYALTGLNESQSELAEAGKNDTASVNQLFSDINTVYSEIENLNADSDAEGNNGSKVEDIAAKWESIAGNLKDGGTAIAADIEEIADDPKQIIFGVAKLAGNEAMDLAKSKLIMEPLAKAMCKKHLVSTKGGSVDTYLHSLGVVPNASGSYYGGIDFNGSTLFPDGSNEIKVCASYDVKVIALLPIDFSFHFEQSAVTHGWLAGEVSFVSDQKKGDEYVENDTLWTQATTKERTEYIRNLAFKSLKSEGYYPLAYPYNTDGILYNPNSNEFVMPRSWNPLSGPENTGVDELNDKVLKQYIESLCGTINSNEFGSSVTVKRDKPDGSTEKTKENCGGAKKRIIITIPEDEGLKEKLEAAIAMSDTDGVTIELVPNYGNGAKQTLVTEGGAEK